MNDRFSKILQYNAPGLGCWGSLILIAITISVFGLGRVIDGFLIIFALAIVTPILAFWGFQWWLKRKLVQDACPVCEYEFTGFKNSAFNCPSCGEALEIENNCFSRITPPGTIDVDAVDISVQVIEEGK